ncbi:hypothetical protein PULV_a1492 [Pseudoalteromonas ulvae UL12]|nr:hypothetical protein [Pseudoalteromonas ulvae UL12]
MFDWFTQLLVRVFIEFFINTVCYYIGWPICRIFTLGKYPKEYPHEEGLFKGFVFYNDVVIVGFITLLVCVGIFIS